MPFRLLLFTCAVFATNAIAQEPKAYLAGALVQKDWVQCAGKEADGSVQIITSKPSRSKKEAVCTEYVLQTERVLYRIRPKDAKHAALLQVGWRAQFRLNQNELLLRVKPLDSEEREYLVVSMTPRAESAADAHRIRLNHLQ
jgi:hypothetical protein